MQDTFPTPAEIREFLDQCSPGYLFPCPEIPRPVPPRSTSHKLRSRYRKRVAPWRLASDFMHALAALDTGFAVTKTIQRGDRPAHGPSCDFINDAQQRLHCLCLREAARLERSRRTDFLDRGGELTGAQATASLLKNHADSRYGARRGPEVPQIPLQSDLLDEPVVEQVVMMLDALSPEESAFYAQESHVLDLAGKSTAQFEEIELHYGFIGGSYDEYVRYLLRSDLPRSMWRFVCDEGDVKAIAGFSAVAKKDGRQRKLLMQCAANYLFADVGQRSELGMMGGRHLAPSTSLPTNGQSLLGTSPTPSLSCRPRVDVGLVLWPGGASWGRVVSVAFQRGGPGQAQ